MKHLMFLIFLFPALLASATQDLDNISKAISKGDVEALSTYFDSNIEISILDEEDFYDKGQAKAVIKKFFNRNQPKSFNLVHKGSSKGKDSKYFIGNLRAGGNTYRGYVYMKVSNGKPLIQELRFDEE